MRRCQLISYVTLFRGKPRIHKMFIGEWCGYLLVPVIQGWMTRTIRSKMTAPMVAVTMAPTMPPPRVRPIPSRGNSTPAIMAPTISHENVAKQAKASSLHQ
jgi:hypothetical protein